MELTKIHPDDDMFQGPIEHYLSCGEEFAEIIVHAAAMTTGSHRYSSFLAAMVGSRGIWCYISPQARSRRQMSWRQQ